MSLPNIHNGGVFAETEEMKLYLPISNTEIISDDSTSSECHSPASEKAYEDDFNNSTTRMQQTHFLPRERPKLSKKILQRLKKDYSHCFDKGLLKQPIKVTLLMFSHVFI